MTDERGEMFEDVPMKKPLAVGDRDAERFWQKVDRSGECWVWIGARSGYRYGSFTVKRRLIKAHRFSYELLKGPINEGLVLDHLCRNTLCVNPDHLEPVTQYENMRRSTGITGYSKTHCIRGHERDLSLQDRHCRICARSRAFKRPRYICKEERTKRGKSRLSEIMTHCRRGHEFNEANTRILERYGYRFRVCRVCDRDKARARRATIRND